LDKKLEAEEGCRDRTMETFLEGVSEEEVATVGMTSQDGDSDQPLGKESSQVKRFIGLQPLVAAGILRLRSSSRSPRRP